MAADESYALSSLSENGGEAFSTYLRDNQKPAFANDIFSRNNNVCDVPEALSPFEIDPVPLFVETAFLRVKFKVHW